MAEVKMSLKEYNDLMDEFNAYRRVVEALATPEEVSDESFESYVKHGGYLSITSEIRMEEHPVLQKLIKEKFYNEYEGLELRLNSSRQCLHLGTVSFESPEECLHCGSPLKDVPKACSSKAYCAECCSVCESYNDGGCWSYERYQQKLAKEREKAE